MINNIVYEDNHILVVFKPSGVLSQQDISNDLDILRSLKQYLVVKYNKPGDAYLGLVHRLDRNTSGLMVFAKTSKAASRLSSSIRQSNFNKYYIAVVEGMIVEKNGVLNNKLLKNNDENKSYVSNHKDAKEAVLEYSLISYDKVKNVSIVKIKLITGRHHQIRVQFSYLGHPIYGDVKYGSKYKIGNFYPLCAYKIDFMHPVLKEQMFFVNFDYFIKDIMNRNIVGDTYEALSTKISTNCA